MGNTNMGNRNNMNMGNKGNMNMGIEIYEHGKSKQYENTWVHEHG